MSTRDELYAVMISLGSDTLLLPNAAVVEVVAADRLERAPGGPAWLAGQFTWQGRRLGALRVEALNGGTPFPDGRRTRVAVVHAITDKVRAGQYGIVCQGHPHLVTLNRKALRGQELQSGDRDALVLSRVGIANTSAMIPDLEALETELSAV